MTDTDVAASTILDRPKPIRSATGKPVVFLHIGEPKTATTPFQQTLWDNRAAFAAHGVDIAGLTPVDSFRGMQDLRDIPVEADHPTGSWVGEWDVLAAQAVRARRVGIISQESIAAASASQVRRAAASLDGGEVHVVISVRDFASLLPAEWQETVKHRATWSWPEFVERIVRTEPKSGARPNWGFWTVHDTPAVLRIWSQIVPADHIHVVTMPRRTSPPELLWTRMASLLDLLDVPVDTASSRRNSSLGFAEVEYLRRLNERIKDEVPNWFYARQVKQAVAHEIFASRPSSKRATLTAQQAEWAAARAESTIEYLRASGHQIVGDLDELRPLPASATSEVTTTPQEQTEIAVAALSGLVERNFRRERREARREAAVASGASGMAAMVRANPPIERRLREFTSRPGVGRWGRIALWQANERRLARQGSRAQA